jgi:hypothetical protein
MKFESKFGIGEVVLTARRYRGSRVLQDQILVITAVVFQVGGEKAYYARTSDGFMCVFQETELIGDPDFDQDAGEYPLCKHGNDKHDCRKCDTEIVAREIGANIEYQDGKISDRKHDVVDACDLCMLEDEEHDAAMNALADQVEPIGQHDDLLDTNGGTVG